MTTAAQKIIVSYPRDIPFNKLARLGLLPIRHDVSQAECRRFDPDRPLHFAEGFGGPCA